MPQNLLRLGHRPRSRWRSSQRSPEFLALLHKLKINIPEKPAKVSNRQFQNCIGCVYVVFDILVIINLSVPRRLWSHNIVDPSTPCKLIFQMILQMVHVDILETLANIKNIRYFCY